MKPGTTHLVALVWRVVIIEDSPEDRAEIRRLLLKGSDRRYHFVEAAVGAAGLSGILNAASGLPQCVVLDYSLPDMDALEVLAELVGADGLTVCPVVVLTGTADARLGPAVLRAGAQDFIGKSWMSPESLTRAVENAAERWAMAHELQAQTAALYDSEALLKQALVEIGNERELLSTTLNSIGDGLITTDAKGRVTNLNPVAEALTGWTTLEAQGQPLTTVFRIVNEATRQPVLNPVFKALEEGVVVGLASHTRLIHKDGTERPIDDSAARICGADLVIKGCVLVFRDITDRKVGEEQLRASAQFNRSLMDGTADSVKVLDMDGRLLHMNTPGLCAMEIDDFESVCGQEWATLWPADARGDIERSVKMAVGGEASSFQALYPTTKGTPKWWDVTVSPVRDADDGQVVRLLAVSRDITERKQAEEQLRQLAADLAEADRRKDEFLATLAHELRNPLGPIRNGLQLIKLAAGQPATIERARSMMERQLTQMVHLVDDLMDVSRISRGQLELRKQHFSLATVLNSAMETSRPLIARMGHELTVLLPEQPVMVDADMTRLTQVFLNLLNNAAKYSDRGGHIRLHVEPQGSDVVVSVKDSGIGIDADQLLRIFEMFTQIGGSLERSQGGLGIGLSLVKRLVDMHGGSVEAKSEGPGMGSEFVVRLPVVIEASKQQASGVDDKSPGTQSLLRILIVDDNRDSADSLSEILKMMGSDTRTAYDGKQGVDMAGEYRPDVILLDIGLPRLNGYEACRVIREQPNGKGVVLIAVTGWGQAEDRRRSREAGFDHHLVKPVDPQALLKMVAELFVG